MKQLASLPLVVKIAFAPAIALLMLAVLATGMIFSQASQTAALHEVVRRDLAESLRLEEISQKVSAANGELYLILTHQAGKVEIEKNEQRLSALSKSLAEVATAVNQSAQGTDESERPEFIALQKDLKDYRDGVDVVGSMLSVDFNTAVSFVQPFERQYGRMTETLNRLVTKVRARSESRAAAAESGANAATMAAILATLATLLGVGALAAAAVLGVRRAVASIAGATGKLARGDTQLDLDALDRKDELGAIVEALKVFRDASFEKARLQQEGDQSRRAAAEERARNDSRQAESAAQQAAVVQCIAEGLERLSRGDLTTSLDDPFAPEYEQLRRDFNGAVSQLRAAISAVADSSDSIRSSTAEIRRATDDLSRRTEHQAATLEETAAAVEQITTTVRQTAQGADHARTNVLRTRGKVEHSGEIMREAVKAMGEMRRSSTEINQIIGVIDEIAFQTNLLALNAGVEAARAGDTGRGFAVVAQEVRALAQRSADAAKEIKALISASSRQVELGVSLVEQTGAALEEVVAQVSDITNLVTGIAKSAQEQAQALAEVNDSVNQMDQVTQQNAAMVEEGAAASSSLAVDAERLSDLMGKFQVGQRAFDAKSGAVAAFRASPSQRRMLAG